MTAKPETLRAYAAIIEMEARGPNGRMRGPGEINIAAAEALRFHADHLEQQEMRRQRSVNGGILII